MSRAHSLLALVAVLASCQSSGTSDVGKVDGGGLDAGGAQDAIAQDAVGFEDALGLEDAVEAMDAAAGMDAPEAMDAAPLADAAALQDAAAPVDAEGTDAVEVLDATPLPDATPDAAAPMDATPLADAETPDLGPSDAGFTSITIIDENGNPVTIVQGPPGLPELIGCADGRREGFLDTAQFPGIAACLGAWTGTQDLRAAPLGLACGNDLVRTCTVPADLCATGWHVCGARTGSVAELTSRTSQTDCANAGGGRYVAAISHCLTQSGCSYDLTPNASYPCFPTGWCSESVCCGTSCRGLGACPSGVWPNTTYIAQGTDQGCGAITSRRAGGVLCCQ